MIEQTPLVSVIVPCFNQGHFLAEALDSLIAQTYSNWECFVIDDGSTDGTRAVARFFTERDSRIKYFWQENGGLSAARNRGLAEVRGEYVQFLDADDTIDPLKFEKQVYAFSRNPSVSLVYSDFLIFDNADRRVQEEISETQKKRYGTKDPLATLFEGNLFVVHSAIVKARYAKEIGGFDERLRRCEDFDFWLRVAAHRNAFDYEPGVLSYYRRVPGSMSSLILKQMLTIIRILRHTGFRLARNPADKCTLLKTISITYGKIAWFYSQSGRCWMSLYFLCRAKLAYGGDKPFFYYLEKGFRYIVREIRRTYEIC